MGGLADIAAGLKLVVFDVDGVFTDGRIWLGSDGTEFKAFSVRDGVGVKALLSAGLEVAIISGRSSPAVDRRMAELGVRHVVQGCSDKAPALRQVIERLGLEPSHVAYLGDDIPDLPAMRIAALPAAVKEAPAEVRALAAWISSAPGGQGAVREFCEFLLGHRRP
jgi:3-deoxy-D-manno-octulosonate 8-phosphate phosphatase (KDO 8-P phosphatase)